MAPSFRALLLVAHGMVCLACGKTGAADPAITEGGCLDSCDEMVEVAAGPFWMGANVGDSCPTNRSDPSAESPESPCHQVDVGAFHIDKYEVTVSRYRPCVDIGLCPTPAPEPMSVATWDVPGKEEAPVVGISWDAARTFCSWEGRRLCSEAEWEKAARGTDGRLYPWGNTPPTCTYAVLSDIAEGGTCPRNAPVLVGSRPAGASPYGALDMAGNIFEWVEDGYHETYSGAPIDGSAWPGTDDRHIDRGGSYVTAAKYLRTSFRAVSLDGAFVDNDLGFRCCRSP